MTIRLEDLLSSSPTRDAAPEVHTEPIDIQEMIPTPEVVEIPEYILSDPEIIGFPDEDYQKAIYDYVAKGLLPISGQVSILDIGCGRGDMAVHFAERYPALNISFVGIDLNKLLIDAGKLKHQPGTPENLKAFAIYDGDYTTMKLVVNVVTIVGTLNLRYTNESDDQWNTLGKMIRHAIEHADVAVKLILLSHVEDDQYVRYPIDETIKLVSQFGLPFNVDASEFDSIYSVTIFIKSLNH